MSLTTIAIDIAAGWCFWSLAHNLGHRWWHDDMRKGKETVYAHGERQHHRLYDSFDSQLQAHEDPQELFISFPASHVAVIAILPIALYGWLRGWSHVLPFGAALYASMAIDHHLHKLFHRSPGLGGVLGHLQRMHSVHHATHNRNFFFVSGFVWDVLFRTVVFAPPRKSTTASSEPVTQ
jgi:hypothetical protein